MVTIGAAFAGSFRSVFREADREVARFGKRVARSMKAGDRAAAGMGKRLSGIERTAAALEERETLSGEEVDALLPHLHVVASDVGAGARA